MFRSKCHAIRAYLLTLEDGASATEIAKVIGGERSAVLRALKRSMPDAYIDRWEKSPKGYGKSMYAAVWDVVRVPPDCPKPSLKEEKHERTTALGVRPTNSICWQAPLR